MIVVAEDPCPWWATSVGSAAVPFGIIIVVVVVSFAPDALARTDAFATRDLGAPPILRRIKSHSRGLFVQFT